MLWEMGDRKASYMQFEVNGLKHAELLACSFKQTEHIVTLKCLQLFVCVAVSFDYEEKATAQTQ